MTSKPNNCCGCDENYKRSTSSEGYVMSSNLTNDFNSLSTFSVPKMDCPAEENLIRTAFSRLGDSIALNFDIPNRKVQIYHADSIENIESTLKSVGLGAHLILHEKIDTKNAIEAKELARNNDVREAKALKWLLTINAAMFILELGFGFIAQSTGLIADSMDMFADAAVYGISLFAVGKAAHLKLKIAHVSGWLQLVLALSVLIEVLRRFYFGSEPISGLMMCVGAIALSANVMCLILIFKSRNNGSHMKASWIFSANDVLANSGVIIAGGLVAYTGSSMPDLVIGLIISFLVFTGAVRILRIK